MRTRRRDKESPETPQADPAPAPYDFADEPRPDAGPTSLDPVKSLIAEPSPVPPPETAPPPDTPPPPPPVAAEAPTPPPTADAAPVSAPEPGVSELAEPAD